MNTQFRKGVLEICVLALISKKDMYGYEIVQNISKVIDVNEGTIYPILRRLTKEEYFETYILESSEGPARKYYKLTELGNENLQKLLIEWKEFVKAVNILIDNKEGGNNFE
ncbi:PadR family transcriptional regulator [Romboutsia lituseburensis]|uniref:PadR family transcriptional regulator, regulatory protein PadR n=1 Tax=Romboutsia lituseburensis DSM 797 TaxID=1121325 RepID=A0A1G9L9L8_9FIRM|nr:PadR family transcriptional regulator [Romboutsia lituseburensis]CEH35220.1 Transcriptional regulator, PadR [Romboutsia lituseburensis]SDL58453.1 PadR family transcriptional regulator, regulatory protein PadR [Romboutsia lituseburensis DSM 797]